MDREGYRSVGALLLCGVAVAGLAGCSSDTSRASVPSGTVAVPSGTAGPTASGPATSTTTASPSNPTSPASSGAASSTTGTSTTTTSPSASTATASTSPDGGTLRSGQSGPAVLALQQRLAELGYWLGTPDGRYGDLTVQAVTALQKEAGLGRDGVLGPRTRAALARGVTPSARSTSGHVVEIDLARQLMLVVDGGTVRTVINVSTGSGARYQAPDGHIGHAVTPPGHYSVFRSVDGWDTSPLGHLYRPRYFNGGIAVHGYPSVPPVPASHGCVRVSLPAMDLIWSQGLMAKGAAVWVY